MSSFSFVTTYLKMTWNHVKYTSQIFMFNVELHECLDKAGEHTQEMQQKMKTGNLYRDVVIRRLNLLNN